MKKMMCVLLATVMMLTLVACGDRDISQNKGNDAQQTQSVDLEKVAEDAIAALGDEYPMFPVESAAELDAYYPGLTDVETKQLVVYQPAVSGYGCELVMVEVANEADAEAVRAILQQRVDSLANDTTYPENAPAWKNNSAVTINGSYVVMGVLPEGITLPAAFKAEF